jgi:hypothetical protein
LAFYQKESTMVRRLSRRAFSAGIALGIPAALLSMPVSGQTLLDPDGTALDLESVLLRVTPYDVRDRLMSSPVADGLGVDRWADISQTPYFSSVGGVIVQQSASGSEIGAFGIYLSPAGARAGQYLGRKALAAATTDVQAQVVGGYAAEVLTYGDGDSRTLTQVPVGNVMILGYDVDTVGESVTNAGMLLEHLRSIVAAA